MDENFSQIKQKIQEQQISITNFTEEYARTAADNFLSLIDGLASEAEKKAQELADPENPALSEITKSYAEFMKNLGAEFGKKAAEIPFESDRNVGERTESLQKFTQLLEQTKLDFGAWADKQSLTNAGALGKDLTESIDTNLEMIDDEQSKLHSFEAQRRWSLTTTAFHRNYKERVTADSLQNTKQNTAEFVKTVAQYALDCTPYKAVPNSSIKALTELAKAADDYRLALGNVDTGISSETAANGKFEAIHKATAAGRKMEKQINEVLKLDLPFNFRDRVLQFAKGADNDGLLAGLDDLAKDGNDLITLLGSEKMPEAGFNYAELDEPNPENLKNTAFTWKEESIAKLSGLTYAQKANPGDKNAIDHEHFVDLVKQLDELHEKLQSNPDYNNTLDAYEGSSDFLSAKAIYEEKGERVSPLNINKLGKGNDYASAINDRLDSLVYTGMLADEYMTAIAQTTYDLNKANPAANKEICTALGQLGMKLQQYHNVISKDVELLDSLQLKTKLHSSTIAGAKAEIKYPARLKNVYDGRRAEEQKTAERAVRDEEKRRIAEEEAQRQQEELRRQAEEEEKEREAQEKRRAEIEKEKKAQQDELKRREAEKKKEAAEEKKQQKEREAEIRRKEKATAERKAKYNRYRDIITLSDNINAFNFEPVASFALGAETPLLGKYYDTVNNLKMYLEKVDNPLAKEILKDVSRIDKINNIYSDAYEYDSDLDLIKERLGKRSADLEKFLGLKDVVIKLDKLTSELNGKTITWSESQGESAEFANLIGFEKISGSPAEVFETIGKRFTEYYHKAAEDGRTLFEKTKAVEEPGIGNIEAFRKEDHSIDRIFGYVPEKKEVAPEETDKAPENAAEDNIVIDTSKQNKAEESSVDTNPEMSKASIARQREKILKCSKLLDESKTFVNSSEYRKLIDLTNKIGKGETKTSEGLSPEKSFAEELYALHIATEKYLNHKAKDGVKKNVFRKLAAVEKTNKLLEECLNELGSTELAINKNSPNKPQRTTDLVVGLEARQAQVREKLGEGTDVPQTKASYANETSAFMGKNPDLPKTDSAAVETGIRNADACMCAIIMKAQLNMDPVSVNSLNAMRDAMLKDPFVPVKEEAEPSIQKKSAEKGKSV